MDTRIEQTTIHTLDDLLNWIINDSGLTPTRRRDISSALRTIARLLARPLYRLPCDLPALRGLLEQIHPAQAGISRKRLQNVRAELVFALNHVRQDGGQIQARRPLSVVWHQLFQLLDTDNLKNGLSGFMHYCSDHHIRPEEVCDQYTADYLGYLQQHTLRHNPNKAYRNACRLWNRAARQIDDWPSIELAVPSFRKPAWSIPWQDFPQSMRDECERYLEWLGGKDLLKEHQPPKICKTGTIQLRRKRIQLLASSAIHYGFPLKDMLSLEVLTSRPVLEMAIRGYLVKTQQQANHYLHGLICDLFAIAKHWVKVDEAHLEWLRSIMRRMDKRPAGLTPKNRDTLRQFDSEANVQRLLALPHDLIAQSKNITNPIRAAVRFQLGLIIEILLLAPMRVGNLAALRIDQHVSRPEGPGGPAILVLLESETKNSTPIEYPLPAFTVKLLDEYLSCHRPILDKDTSNHWLWPGASDGHKKEARISQQVKEVIYQQTGLSLTAHQFRHLAARLILDEQPGSYELVRQLLGHKNLKTTVNFYAGMRSRAAVEHYDRLITEKRKGLNG